MMFLETFFVVAEIVILYEYLYCSWVSGLIVRCFQSNYNGLFQLNLLVRYFENTQIIICIVHMQIEEKIPIIPFKLLYMEMSNKARSKHFLPDRKFVHLLPFKCIFHTMCVTRNYKINF